MTSFAWECEDEYSWVLQVLFHLEPEAATTRRVSIPPRTKRSWIVHLKVKGGSRFLAL